VSCDTNLRNSKVTCSFRHKSQGRHQICYYMCIFPNLLYIMICFIVLYAIFPMLWRHIRLSTYVFYLDGHQCHPVDIYGCSFSRNTYKMQLCNIIYYSKVEWRLNMFRAAYRSSSGALNCICSLWFIYPRGDQSLPRLSGKWILGI